MGIKNGALAFHSISTTACFQYSFCKHPKLAAINLPQSMQQYKLNVDSTFV